MTFQPQSFPVRRFLMIPVLAVACWLFIQKGCVLTPDISPESTRNNAETAVAPPAFAGAGPEEAHALHSPLSEEWSTSVSRKPKNRSLQHASDLLRKAAVLLDHNDRSAIRLILEAIAILKREIMRGADAPEYDRISVQPPASHGGALSPESLTVISRPEGSSSCDSRIAPALIVETIAPLHGRFMSAHAGWTTERME